MNGRSTAGYYRPCASSRPDMAFCFSLATVLRLREVAEAREERLLTQILHQVARQQGELAALAAGRAAVGMERAAALDLRTRAAAVQDLEARLLGIDQAQTHGAEQLLKLEKLRDTQRKHYEAAHCACELLTAMRATQHDLFQNKLARQEQKAMDDNFAARRSFH